jgi:kynurenine 3-monooxygenase
MVTFRRVPYRVAYERGEDQWRILEELTTGRTSIEEVDLAVADELVTARLTPLG